MNSKRFLASAVIGISGAIAGVALVAQPAAADSWRTISSDENCYTYSYGRTCTTTVTQMRDVPYCTDPPIDDPFGTMGWANYCMRYDETTRWV